MFSVSDLRAAFDSAAPFTVGIEEEVMLLHPQTLELAPVAPTVLARLGGDDRFKLELPASQLEIVLGPCASVSELAPALADARHALARAADGIALPAAAGAHPFSAAVGALNSGERYAQVIAQYGPMAKRQLVCALQIHVAAGGAERTLAVYNALRSYLPLLAALAANAPFYEGVDTGLASVRPKLCELLPRQGVPPVIESWEEYARSLAWGRRAGAFADSRMWWWELRPHPEYGTLEIRVPDSQSSAADAIAVAGVAHATVLWLAERYDAGEQLPSPPTWRIEENRWSACRDGPGGTMADPGAGEPRPTRDWLLELVELLGPIAQRLDATAGLDHARRLIAEGGAAAQRRMAEADSAHGAAAWLAERFLAS